MEIIDDFDYSTENLIKEGFTYNLPLYAWIKLLPDNEDWAHTHEVITDLKLEYVANGRKNKSMMKDIIKATDNIHRILETK